VTDLDGNYNSDEDSMLTSPIFDFSALPEDPYLHFANVMWIEPIFDWLKVEYTINGGGTWQRLGLLGTGYNWYNDDDDHWTGAAAPEWRTSSHPVPGSAGSSQVQVRFAFHSSATEADEGVAIDDVAIGRGFVDLAVVSTSPAHASGCFTEEQIVVSVRNLGGETVTGFDVGYRADAGVAVVERVTTPLMPGATIAHAFAPLADLSAAGAHALEVFVTAASDISPRNDRILAHLTNEVVVVVAASYSESFETSDGGFQASGALPSWQWGTPAAVEIASAGHGAKAWVTGLAGDYNSEERSFLTSPCLDLSSFGGDPVLSFLLNRQLSLQDGLAVDVSTDGGASWSRLGAEGEGTGWYNRGDVWEGFSAGWALASHALTGAGGQSKVRIRFALEVPFTTVTMEGAGIDALEITP
jgi:hypothetical protein